MAQVDPVDYGLLERKGRQTGAGARAGRAMGDAPGRHELALRHGWRRTSTRGPCCSRSPATDLGLSGTDLPAAGRSTSSRTMSGRSSARFALYEVLVREGFDAARATVLRLVRRR